MPGHEPTISTSHDKIRSLNVPQHQQRLALVTRQVCIYYRIVADLAARPSIPSLQDRLSRPVKGYGVQKNAHLDLIAWQSHFRQGEELVNFPKGGRVLCPPVFNLKSGEFWTLCYVFTQRTGSFWRQLRENIQKLWVRTTGVSLVPVSMPLTCP